MVRQRRGLIQIHILQQAKQRKTAWVWRLKTKNIKIKYVDNNDNRRDQVKLVASSENLIKIASYSNIRTIINLELELYVD